MKRIIFLTVVLVACCTHLSPYGQHNKEGEITLLPACVYLDEDNEPIITAIDQRLKLANYTIIGSHDYREVVPEHMNITIEYLNAHYNIEYVTINRIGEMVRNGEIRNNW